VDFLAGALDACVSASRRNQQRRKRPPAGGRS